MTARLARARTRRPRQADRRPRSGCSARRRARWRGTWSSHTLPCARTGGGSSRSWGSIQRAAIRPPRTRARLGGVPRRRTRRKRSRRPRRWQNVSVGAWETSRTSPASAIAWPHDETSESHARPRECEHLLYLRRDSRARGARIDSRRVYATGMSNRFLAHRLACERANLTARLPLRREAVASRSER